MKDGLNYALFGTVVAVAAGLFGAYGIPDFTQTESSFASAQMLGHVTYTVTDADGNIKAYRQLDNIIVNDGEDCAARLLFTNSSTGVSPNDGTINGETGTGSANQCWFQSDPFVHIAIGNGSAGVNTAAGDDADLVDEHDTNAGSGLLRLSDSVPTFNGASIATPAQVIISKDFTLVVDATSLLGSPQVVNESGLFNSSTPVANTGMFSRQTFADVSINDGETLTVEWTINIGGAATLGGSEEL